MTAALTLTASLVAATVLVAAALRAFRLHGEARDSMDALKLADEHEEAVRHVASATLRRARFRLAAIILDALIVVMLLLVLIPRGGQVTTAGAVIVALFALSVVGHAVDARLEAVERLRIVREVSWERRRGPDG